MMGIVAMAQVLVRWPPSQEILPGGYFHVFRDDRDGVVDYDSPINPAPIPAWIDNEGKVGVGLGPFGEGAFGIGAGGAGLGGGHFGMGIFGVGAELISFTTPLLADGTWTIAVVGYDAAGNRVIVAVLEQTVTIAGSPERIPARPTFSNYDAGGNLVTANWALSPDDEG